jgi:hypothetical protein
MPATKIAERLVDDPEEFCSCVRNIDVSNINCTGFGVVSYCSTCSLDALASR